MINAILKLIPDISFVLSLRKEVKSLLLFMCMYVIFCNKKTVVIRVNLKEIFILNKLCIIKNETIIRDDKKYVPSLYIFNRIIREKLNWSMNK